MKIIGIFGGSGSGKTTATQMLHKKIDDSVVLAMDAFMHKHWDEHKKEILDTLNVKDKENIWWYNYIVSSIENIKKAINIIKPEMEKDIKKFIIENQRYNTIIIDWVFLPLIPAFYNCDFSISINSDMETKIERLSTRLDANNKLQKWPRTSLLERINNTALDELGYVSKYSIQNTGTLDDLNNKLKEILLKEHMNFNEDKNESNNIIYWNMDK